MYTIKINGQIVSVNKYKTTVAKSVKVSKVAFDFDESWDNLSIFACFRNANIGQEYTVQITKPYEVDIPWEVLQVAGKLEVGALGLNNDGIVKPTIWCTISDIVNGVSTDGIESAEPTPEIVVQITETADKAMDVANDAYRIATSVKQSADAGLFDGKSAYEVAVDNGFQGTEQEWLDSLSSSAQGEALPSVTEEDNGKVLMVADGKWSKGELPIYEGVFEVVPSTEESIILKTAQKMMDADVKVEKIPYAEVSNASNGTTVTIG